MGSGIVTEAEIEAAKTPAGGWTRETLAGWGVSWPPPKGWRAALLNRVPAPSFGDSEIMIGAAAALGRSHAERGLEPYWQAIFPKRQAAYIRAYNERKAELCAGEKQ